jgi:hypothetical protein
MNTAIWQRLLRHLPSRALVEGVQQDVLNSQAAQRAIFLAVQARAGLGGRGPRWADMGFRVFSQADEDGLLLFIFALIGFGPRVCVDFGAATPQGSNTANLFCNWGFTGLLVDGSEEYAERSRRYYASNRDTWLHPPLVKHAWVTAENCNRLIEDSGIKGEIDLLSVDIDGVDYWIWKAITIVQPRVVVIEVQSIWGTDRCVTVPYAPDFRRPGSGYEYCGASLPALVKLGHEKGYKLVGTNRYGYNAFFVRTDLAGDTLPEVRAQSCVSHPRALAQRALQARSVTYPWEEV